MALHFKIGDEASTNEATANSQNQTPVDGEEFSDSEDSNNVAKTHEEQKQTD